MTQSSPSARRRWHCARPSYQHDRDAVVKTTVILQMGGACQKCGYATYVTALEFHHVDTNDKDTDPSQLIRNGNHDIMKQELEKCILLCRNCHMAYHAKEWTATFVKREGWGWTVDVSAEQSRLRWRPACTVQFRDPLFADLVNQAYMEVC